MSEIKEAKIEEKKLAIMFEKISKLEKQNSKTREFRDAEMVDYIKSIIKEEADRCY